MDVLCINYFPCHNWFVAVWFNSYNIFIRKTENNVDAFRTERPV